MTGWRSLPLRVRLVALFSVLLTAALIAVGGLALALLKSSLVREVDSQLLRAAQGLVDTAFSQATQMQPPVNSMLPTDYAVALANPDGSVFVRCVGGSCGLLGNASATAIGPNFGSLDAASVQTRTGVPFTVRSLQGEATWRAVVAPVTSANGTVTGTAAVALPLDAVNATMGMMIGALLAVSGGVLALAALATYALVRSSLQPLRQIETTAARIAAGDLTQRVEAAPVTTEVGSLASSLNTMLGQVESSFTAQQASEQRMKAFVGDASHELRTPLATVAGYTELYRLGGIPQEELPGVMARIEASSLRMRTLVTDLLSLARLDEGAPLQIEALAPAVHLHEAARDLAVLDPSREVRVNARASRQVLADDGALRQILTNLVGNAAAYSPAGSPVELASQDGEDGVYLVVIDHGPGVPEADRSRIFERFARLDEGRTRDAGGSGLGLSIVSALTSALGGWVRCEETPGGGATMRVWLPAADPS